MLVNSVPLLPLKSHDGFQLLALFTSSLAQVFETFKGFTCHWFFVAKSQEIQVHMETKGQRNFKFVQTVLSSCGRQSGCSDNVVVEVAIDFAEVTILITSGKAGEFSGHG